MTGSRIVLLAGWIFFTIGLWSQSFTLPDILGAPYCSDLTASPKGDQIAWIANEKGIRMLFTAEAPEFSPQLRYQANYDDGQVISNIKFNHTGTALYYVKGSALNRAGEVANPSSEAIYPQRLLFEIDLKSGLTDTLGPFANFIVGPDDRDLILTSGNRIDRLDLQTKSKAVQVEMRGTVSDISYSPDGTTLLFASNRDNHSFIGYYVLGSRNISWIGPSVYKDQFPVWSDSGAKIAFIRAPGDRKGALADITSGNHFSIMVYDFTADELTKVWSSPGDDGGFAQYYHEFPLRWYGDDQLIFYSEHEGWMKIYDLDLKTEHTTNLLPGECEIEHSALAQKKGMVIFSANCGDLDRRDLFEYDLGTRQTTQITTSEEIETDPILLEGGAYVFRRGSSFRPTSIAIKRGAEDRTIYPEVLQSAFPVSTQVIPRPVIFESGDGMQIHGQLFTKDSSIQQPAILFMHGGPIRQMLLGYHYSSYYANAYTFNQYLANQGYVVLSVNYRSGIGYGKAFRRAKNQGPRGASEYQDILAAGRYLQGQKFVDADRIGLWGGSYGGLLTAQGLARNSGLFKAGVDFHGVHDWSWRATDFSKGGFWGISEELMDLAYRSSPVANMQNWTSPVLLIHGDDDRNVMFGQSIDLAARLQDHNIPHEILVFPDEVHGFYRYDSWLRSFEASAEFFNRILKN